MTLRFRPANPFDCNVDSDLCTSGNLNAESGFPVAGKKTGEGHTFTTLNLRRLVMKNCRFSFSNFWCQVRSESFTDLIHKCQAILLFYSFTGVVAGYVASRLLRAMRPRGSRYNWFRLAVLTSVTWSWLS